MKINTELYILFQNACDHIELHCDHMQAKKKEITEFLDLCKNLRVLSYLEIEEEIVFLRDDIEQNMDFYSQNILKENPKDYYNLKNIYRSNFFYEILFFANTIVLVDKQSLSYHEYAILRNLFLLNNSQSQVFDNPIEFIFAGLTIRTNSKIVQDYLDKEKKQINIIKNNKMSFFSNSTQYMGNKNSLSSFLTSIMSFQNTKNMPILDLMCGSGAASSAFCQFWDVFASDAQHFCTILAMIQGRNEKLHSATEILELMMPYYKSNYLELSKLYETELKIEDALFHSDYGSGKDIQIYKQYLEYSEKVFSYKTADFSPDFEIKYFNGFDIFTDMIKKRKENTRTLPYCLFTFYFSNIYFGLMQSLQIDSLRYAIEQLENTSDRLWALGALIVACSARGTNFGGHFAQPLKITEKNISRILEERNKSILREFNKRLDALIESSRTIPNKISIIEGPWEKALKNDILQSYKDVYVYVDAPYKREEYSRYYHLFETLVQYDYPACEGKGCLSSKKNRERFKSDFFTESRSKINNLFVQIFEQILEKKWNCVWSYSNNGIAAIDEVVARVSKTTNCDVTIYQTSYQHQNHGNALKQNYKKNVYEYVIIFKKKSIS